MIGLLRPLAWAFSAAALAASTPAFHRARVWRRRRPRKTTLGKSRYRTISRVRVDELLLAGGLRLRFPLPESVNPVPPSGTYRDALTVCLRPSLRGPARTAGQICRSNGGSSGGVSWQAGEGAARPHPFLEGPRPCARRGFPAGPCR